MYKHGQLASRERHAIVLVQERQKEISDYAMALDLLKTLTQVRGEALVIQRIIEIFTLLFAPRSISYHPACGVSAEPRTLTRRENGFILPVSSGGQVLGILDVEGFQFPDYANHYLNLASGIESICGLAIENARHYQEMAVKQQELEELNLTLQQRIQETVSELRQKDQALVHKSRMAAMGEMIGNIAHQWRQPLNALGLLIFNVKDAFQADTLDAKPWIRRLPTVTA